MHVRHLLSLALVAGSAFSLAGCVSPTPAQRRQLDALIGHTPVDVVRAFGVPTRSYAADGHSFLAYVDEESSYFPGGPGPGWGWGGYGWGGGWGGWGGGWAGGYGGWGGGFPPSYSSSSCQTTFEVTDDKVAAWTMRGNGC